MVRILALLATLTATPAPAEDAPLADLLARKILDPGIPLLEVQEYTESRVLPMPEFQAADQWEEYARDLRERTLREVVFRGEAAEWRNAETDVEWLETIEGGPGYEIRKLRYEALPGLWIPALLYQPDVLVEKDIKVPVVLNVNGHDREGKAADYKQIRCINQAKRGMLALNVEWLGMGQLRSDGFGHYRANQLDLCGTSGVAPFYLAMSRALDLLLSLEHADPQRVAVAGLSGGGWQTIFISALDERVTLANPVAGYSSYLTRARHVQDLGDSEQTPVDLAATADYAHLTALRAPRPTLLTYNAADQCCFKADHALPPLVAAAEPIYRLYGKPSHLRAHVNHDPGTHNFDLDNRQQLYRMLGDFFYEDSEYSSDEIPSADEVKTSEQLHVELPEDNRDFHTLALEFSRHLPRGAELPGHRQPGDEWRAARRKELRELLRAKDYDLQAIPVAEHQSGETAATHWWFRVGGHWTVPAVELARGEPGATVLLIADGGRESAADHVERLLAEGHRVLAVDPFYLGESKIAQKDFLYALLVSSVGDRPLGLQVSQLAAIARRMNERGTGPVKVVAIGPRTSLIALATAGLADDAIAEVELYGSLGSLKEVIEQNRGVNEMPEMFCFGLLEKFDIPQLAALVAPRPVRFVPAE
jgi:hypothetical protein